MSALTALAEQVATLKEDVKAHENTINGNGQKGLKGRIDILETNLANIQKSLDGIGTKMWALVILAVGQILGVALLMLTHSGPFAISK